MLSLIQSVSQIVVDFIHWQAYVLYCTHKPWLAVLADQTDKRVNLCSSDVFLQQLSVVMEQSCDRVLCQDIIADLFLHEAKLFGNVLLQDRDTTGLNICTQTKSG